MDDYQGDRYAPDRITVSDSCVHYVHYVLSLTCLKEIQDLGRGRVHCWRAGGVWGRRVCLLHVRFSPNTAWKLVIGNFNIWNKNIVSQYYHYYLSVDFNSGCLVGL